MRQQLLVLQREGWIETDVERDRVRTGRPATIYRLSTKGDELFPKHYDALAVAVIDAAAAELGVDAALRVLARVADDRVHAVAPSLEGLPLAERVDALKNWYLAGDPYMGIERDGEDYRLIERNCPFMSIAMQRPALCSVSVNALTRLLGVRVEREEKFQNGDGRCVFRVKSAEPIDADAWAFELERATPRPTPS